MKTLHEVIDACEDSVAQLCFDCHIGYCKDSDCFIADALHYLYEYRSTTHLEEVWQQEAEKCKEARERFTVLYKEYQERISNVEPRNPPLTWDELKQMEGKPVWVEVDGYNGYWTIVHWNRNTVFEEYYDWNASPEDPMKAPLVSLDDTNIGKTWQAYRKERE